MKLSGYDQGPKMNPTSNNEPEANGKRLRNAMILFVVALLVVLGVLPALGQNTLALAILLLVLVLGAFAFVEWIKRQDS